MHLDVGTNTRSILEDPFYQGLRQTRDQSEAYDELVAEFFRAAKATYGRNVLIQVRMCLWCHLLLPNDSLFYLVTVRRFR